jgi:Icc-related predicted phosphoesterase
MTTVQIVSDLHIEYKNDYIPNPLKFITPSADILILAGDIGSLYKKNQLLQFLLLLCPHFQFVLYIPGNHEFYRVQDIREVSIKTLKDRLRFIELSIQNLYILDRKSVRFGDICIAGCTLWTKPDIPIPKYLVRIHEMNTQVYSDIHNNDVKYINKMIKFCHKKKLRLVVVTHHGPTYQILKGKKNCDKFISLYVNNLDYLLVKNKIHTWICGHIHQNFDFKTEGGTRIVGNQKGKPKDKIQDFSKKFTIKI